MDEHYADVGGGITLCHETFGRPGDPPVLLVMGLGMQMLAWDERFCRALADRGFFVIRYDNRDAGRSTRLDDVPPPTAWQLLRRDGTGAAYRLVDLARDAAGLLDALGLEAAHVVGASMGGMIAQTLAARHPARVRSLVSIMSSTGARLSGQPAPVMYPIFLRRPPRDRDGYVEHTLGVLRRIGSPAYDRDELELREVMGLGFDRGIHPAGTGRQLHAILASGDRRRELRAVEAPTLVIHGRADRLVRPSGGRATARAIPGARLWTVPGMGHDLPRALWPQLLATLEQHFRAADAGGQAGAAAGAERTAA